MAIKDKEGPAVAPAIKGKVSDETVLGTEEIALQETREHQQKMGRYRQQAALTISDEIFIPIIVAIMHRAREPLQRWFYWMERNEVLIVLNGRKRQCGLIAQMVRT